jgi:hypothetical protein
MKFRNRHGARFFGERGEIMRVFNHALFAWFLVLLPCIFLIGGQPNIKNDVPDKISEKNITKTSRIRDVRFSVALPAKTVAGNSLNLVLTVTNEGKEEVGFLIGHYRDLNLKVLDAKGTAVGLTRYGQWAIGKEGESTPNGRRVTKLVPPGKSYSETVNLARLFDLSISGDYTLSLKRIVIEYSKSRPEIALGIKDVSFKVVEPGR